MSHIRKSLGTPSTHSRQSLGHIRLSHFVECDMDYSDSPDSWVMSHIWLSHMWDMTQVTWVVWVTLWHGLLRLTWLMSHVSHSNVTWTHSTLTFRRSWPGILECVLWVESSVTWVMWVLCGMSHVSHVSHESSESWESHIQVTWMQKAQMTRNTRMSLVSRVLCDMSHVSALWHESCESCESYEACESWESHIQVTWMQKAQMQKAEMTRNTRMRLVSRVLCDMSHVSRSPTSKWPGCKMHRWPMSLTDDPSHIHVRVIYEDSTHITHSSVQITHVPHASELDAKTRGGSRITHVSHWWSKS